MVTTEEYAPGRLVDVHGNGDQGVVLLWHGRAANSRSALVHLGAAVAEHGVRVVVPDWDWSDSDGGKSALTASLAHARRVSEQIGTDPDRLVLTGWSLGGTAALGLVASTDEPAARVVLLAPGDGPGAVVPFTGDPLPETFPDGTHRPRVDVVCPAHDDVTVPASIRALAQRLEATDWSTSWTDLEADHWSVAMTRFDAEADAVLPEADETERAPGRRVARIIADR